MKNPEDIFDMSTFEGMKKELDRLRPGIEEHFDGKIEGEKADTLKEIRAFVNQTSNDYKDKFLELIEEYRAKRGEFSERMLKHIKNKSFDLPTFIIADGLEAERILKNMGFEGDFEDDAFLVSFQLPKPLAQFWWKGGDMTRGKFTKKIDATVIEWRLFYEDLMPVIWTALDECESDQGLNFKRINGAGVHDPKKYYYIWKVSRRSVNDWSNDASHAQEWKKMIEENLRDYGS